MSRVIDYESDGAGRIYARYDDGEVIPTGITAPALASRNDITLAEVVAAAVSESPPEGTKP